MGGTWRFQQSTLRDMKLHRLRRTSEYLVIVEVKIVVIAVPNTGGPFLMLPRSMLRTENWFLLPWGEDAEAWFGGLFGSGVRAVLLAEPV